MVLFGFPLLIALALTLGSACGRAPEDKLVNWPPSEPVVPVRDVIEDADVEAPDTAPAPEPDTTPVEVVEPPLPPCAELVRLLCDRWTHFADACREARTRTPDDKHPPTRDACQALVDKINSPETRWGSPCSRYARALCAESGDTSDRCKAAQARIAVLTTKRDWQACIADLVWFEARTLRR